MAAKKQRAKLWVRVRNRPKWINDFVFKWLDTKISRKFMSIMSCHHPFHPAVNNNKDNRLLHVDTGYSLHTHLCILCRFIDIRNYSHRADFRICNFVSSHENDMDLICRNQFASDARKIADYHQNYWDRFVLLYYLYRCMIFTTLESEHICIRAHWHVYMVPIHVRWCVCYIYAERKCTLIRAKCTYWYIHVDVHVYHCFITHSCKQMNRERGGIFWNSTFALLLSHIFAVRYQCTIIDTYSNKLVPLPLHIILMRCMLCIPHIFHNTYRFTAAYISVNCFRRLWLICFYYSIYFHFNFFTVYSFTLSFFLLPIVPNPANFRSFPIEFEFDSIWCDRFDIYFSILWQFIYRKHIVMVWHRSFVGWFCILSNSHSVFCLIFYLSLCFCLSFLPFLLPYVDVCVYLSIYRSIVVQWWYLFTDKLLAPNKTKSDMLMLDFVFLNKHNNIPCIVYISYI